MPSTCKRTYLSNSPKHASPSTMPISRPSLSSPLASPGGPSVSISNPDISSSSLKYDLKQEQINDKHEIQPMMNPQDYPEPGPWDNLQDEEESDLAISITRPHRVTGRGGGGSIFPWIPHLLLIVTYCGVLVSWSSFRPQLDATESRMSPEHLFNWEAYFLGTFAEIGDYFNVSDTNPTRMISPGAEAAWEQVRQVDKTNSVDRSKANLVRINRAEILSPKEGDKTALTRVHRLHCLHVLWRRWHNQITDEEKRVRIATQPHDDHCFAVLRYALMCNQDFIIKRVGWTATKKMHGGWIDVARFCKGLDPDQNGGEENALVGSNSFN